MNIRVILILTIVLIGSMSLSAQEKKSVVYLKSGRIISGTIIELIPDEYVRIEVDAVTVRTIPFSEIASIRNERMEYFAEKAASSNYWNRITVSLFAGAAFPADEFANVSNANAGYAETGYFVGGNVNFPVFRSFILNTVAAVSNHAVNNDGLHLSGVPRSIDIISTSWALFWTMPGLGWKTDLEGLTFTAALNYGWAHTKTPSISLSGNFSSCTAHSFQTTSSAFGFSFELVIWKHASVSFRSFSTQPIIPVTIMSHPEYLKPLSGNPSVPRDLNERQPITVYALTAGISF